MIPGQGESSLWAKAIILGQLRSNEGLNAFIYVGLLAPWPVTPGELQPLKLWRGQSIERKMSSETSSYYGYWKTEYVQVPFHGRL